MGMGRGAWAPFGRLCSPVVGIRGAGGRRWWLEGLRGGGLAIEWMDG